MASPTVPSTMRAWTYSTRGEYRQVLKLNEIPAPNPPVGGNVIVKIAYAVVNPGDVKLMRLIPTLLRQKNSIPGTEYSGVIFARGPSATDNLSIGTRVFGMLSREYLMSGIGVLCEYVLLDPKKVMVSPVPQNTSLEEASALPTAALLAWHACVRGSIPLSNNYRVLVNGASGGCGSMFVQAVLAQGAKEVIGTCSATNLELVKSLGASRVIDYQAIGPLPEYLAREYGAPDQQFDFILDTVGSQNLYTNSPKYLREGGIFMNIGDYTNGTVITALCWLLNIIQPTWLGGTPRKYVMFSGNVDLKGADWAVRYIAEGKLKAVIDKSYAFEEVLDVMDLVDTKRVKGRLVIKVGDVI
ncbi:NAD(P)-binding protein [Pleomassaria siparia CBS 279.74]|uniref:NAD(P)-binding protein n=1 Tax=Pleomassaria siparia CBS 279.74 TaxID=1314801 RepID=A0A6G1KAD3_9PLEO|nr:NAD(P)-binding protein [Pleomassaria siparia CBS 279.74]